MISDGCKGKMANYSVIIFILTLIQKSKAVPSHFCDPQHWSLKVFSVITTVHLIFVSKKKKKNLITLYDHLNTLPYTADQHSTGQELRQYSTSLRHLFLVMFKLQFMQQIPQINFVFISGKEFENIQIEITP